MVVEALDCGIVTGSDDDGVGREGCVLLQMLL